MGMARRTVLESILELAESYDRQANRAAAMGHQLAADGWRIGSQQINPYRRVEQIHSG
jgi:hypothetical protein